VIPAGPNRGRKRGLNEDYARELMELHTLGVDGGYTQRDVIEVARAFTSSTIHRPRVEGRFGFRSLMHDARRTAVRGYRIRCGGGHDEGERVIERVRQHQSTARIVASKLLGRFVSHPPPPALVDRVAAAYTEGGGDIPAMLRVIFVPREFPGEDASLTKIKK